jgi:hypothetical protein
MTQLEECTVSQPDPRQNSLYYKLLSHEFVILLLHQLSPLHNIVSSKLKNKSENDKIEIDIKAQTKMILGAMYTTNTRLSAEILYHNEVFQYVSSLTHAVERLEMSPIYISRFTRSKLYDDSGITLHRWIQYHYSNYLVTAVSIYDTALLLTNAVFALGIKPRDCSNKTITKNSRVSQTSVKNALNNLDNITKDFRQPRNLFVHRNIIPDLDFLDHLEGIKFVDEVSEPFDIEQNPLMHPKIAEMLYKSERRKLVKVLQQQTQGIAEEAHDLYTQLLPVYSKCSALLKGEDA